MALDAREERHEREHLKKIYQLILKRIKDTEKTLSLKKEEIVAFSKHSWNEEAKNWLRTDFDAMIDIVQDMKEIKKSRIGYDIYNEGLAKLYALEKTPYFGRIDFHEDGMDNETFYIGVDTFSDKSSYDILIYDWRAPISSIFYDYQSGRAQYTTKNNSIEGELTLKRQFKLWHDIIDYMFESDIKIDDDILQEILSGNADDKMKTIVATIQTEQNRIIRDDVNRLLVVHGAAGSGKTSIALHRIAWFLYRYREMGVTSKNILILSPNIMFSDYISNVLPELGEENVWQTTFSQLTSQLSDDNWNVTEPSLQMDEILSGKADEHLSTEIDFKTSHQFAEIVHKYADKIEANGIILKDIKHLDYVIISKKEMTDLYFDKMSESPMISRLMRIKQRIEDKMQKLWKIRLAHHLKDIEEDSSIIERHAAEARLRNFKEFVKTRQIIEDIFTINLDKLYLQMYDTNVMSDLSSDDLPNNIEEIATISFERLISGELAPQEASAYLYFRNKLTGKTSSSLVRGDQDRSDIRYVVVDEAQDYSPMDYYLLRQLFPNQRFTLLGDPNQSIHPWRRIYDYDSLKTLFGNVENELINLKRCYRSTLPITGFTSSIIGRDDIISVERPGDAVDISAFSNEDKMLKYTAQLVKKALNDGYASIAVLVKNAGKVDEAASALDGTADYSIITTNTTEYSKGVVISPSYLIKGLEFDVVICLDMDKENYPGDEYKRLIYTMTSRALHRLHILHTGKSLFK